MRTTFVDVFPGTAHRHSSRVAVVDGERRLSYADLLADSLRLATRLVDLLDGASNQPVGVLLPKSCESITADLGILLSANFYMNLDVKSPEHRLQAILDQVRPALIVTTRDIAAQFPSLSENQRGILLIDDDSWRESPVDEAALERRRQRVIDTDPMCIINTSGSTGTPKSVVLNHRSFVDFTAWAIENQGLGDDEVLGSLSPTVFDIYSFELCMMMELGSTFVVLSDTVAAFPARLLDLVASNGVTFLFWVPTILVNIANADLLSRIPLPALRFLWFAGEVFPTRQFNYWRRMLPQARTTNLYGPIEITLDCTTLTIDREWPEEEPLPIGYACTNTDVLVLDGDRPCAPGEEGELCVRGTSLAMGYYNDPEKTSRAFVQNPLNPSYPELIYRTGDIVMREESGLIHFRGRRDTLVKHAGYRIELTEIEHVIVSNLQLVTNGCAIYDHAAKQIVFVYEADADIPVAEFRSRLGQDLPRYMVPGRLQRVDEMPRNTNGKIDRLSLAGQVLS